MAASAAAQVESARLTGDLTFGDFGRALAAVGDVDGDHADDFLVSEPMARSASGKTGVGRVDLVSGATYAVIRSHEGPQQADQLGAAIASLGDIDLDGVPDYAISAPRHYAGGLAGAGEVRAFSGATGQLLWAVEGTRQFEYFGTQIVGVGDMDADGRPELLVLSRVEATIVSGLGVKGMVLNTLGNAISSIGRAGDLDGDGLDEILVGSHLYSGPRHQQGLVMVFSGATGLQISSFTGAKKRDAIGWRVLGIDDVDGDGVRDLIASGRLFTDDNTITDGMVEVRSGATLAVIATVVGNAYDYFGMTIGAVGDWNRDGVDDWAANANLNSIVGGVRVISGASGTLLHQIDGEYDYTTTEHAHDFGAAITGGDWNGDGIGDIAVGAPMWHDADFEYEGAAYAFLGCPAYWQSYGAGWPGTLGTPVLVASNDPVVGQLITVTASNSLGAATSGLLLVGLDAASVTLPSGATLLVDQPLLMPVSIPATGLSVSSTLPDDPALYFADLFLQVIEFDPAAVGHLSFTQGVDLRCGFDL